MQTKLSIPAVVQANFKSDISEEFLPFAFKGFGLESQCFLRFSVVQGRCLILIAQLPDYLGTDVTTGFDEIFEAFAARLVDSDQVEFTAAETTKFDRFLQKMGLRQSPCASNDNRLEAARVLCARSDWVVCYPPGVGLISNESFAVVRIDAERNYFFNYRLRENIVKQLSVQDEDLTIDYEALERHIACEAAI